VEIPGRYAYPRSFSGNYLVATAEGEGDATDLEATPEIIYFLFPKDGLIVHERQDLMVIGVTPQLVTALLDVSEQIEMLVERYHAREIFDDTGTFPGGDWLKTFCEGMIERGLHKEILFSCNMRFDFLAKRPDLPPLMKKAGFRGLFTGITSAFQIVVREDSPIQSIADLKGQRLGTASLNDGGEIMARVALEAYGLTYKDGKSVRHLALGELANAFKEREISEISCCLFSALPEPRINCR
jgi:hypothetical protein